MIGYLRCCILCLLNFVAFAVSAQHYVLTGKVTEIKGSNVPFVSVYVDNTTQGTSSNIDGQYKLTLPAGKVELLFTAVGYEDRRVTVMMKENTILDIVLAPKIFMLNDVIIKSRTEDLANEMIKKVIAKRKTYLNEIDAFSTEVYTKAMQKLVSAPKRFFGRNVATILDLDSNRQGIIYLSETESKLDFKQRDKVKEVMISSKIAGDNNGFSFNKASDLIVNFYNNVLFEDKLSVRGFVSPVADNAFSYYKYKFLGNSEENGKTISKIQVIPKRGSLPVFSGVIYIVKDSWRINAVNLFVTKENGIELIDTLTVKQQLVEIGDVYVPQSIQFSIAGKTE